MTEIIPYGKQDISQQDIDSVVEVLRSDFLTQGPKVPEFEGLLTSLSKSKYAVAVNSATSALHIACMAIGLKEKEWLWTSPISFVASANAGLYCGAKIDFVDIDPKTYNLCPSKLKKKLEDANLNGRLPKVLIPVHLGGQPCDMKKIKKLCDKFNVKIIEDASHAIGSSYLGEKTGSCIYSDITIFSFHPVKIVTTAEGGIALTNDSDLAEKMNLYRTHGITKDFKGNEKKSHGSWYYEQVALGYNYRLTDLHAALGISQIKRLDEFVSARNKLAQRYNILFKDFPLKLPFQLKGTTSSFHLYIIRLKLEKINNTHKEVFESLRKNNIGVNIHYIPIHLQPFFKKMGFKLGDFPEAEKYYSEAISLPIFPNLSKGNQDRVVKTLEALLG